MAIINQNITQSFLQQHDGVLALDEEMRIRKYAETYAVVEDSIAVVSNFRTNQCHIYMGKTAEILGMEKAGTYLIGDSAFEMEIFSCVHPDDMVIRDLQELIFMNMMKTPANEADGYPYYMETVMRMKDADGKYHNVCHRIHYFKSADKPGISYGICIYNLTQQNYKYARVIRKLTGEERRIEVTDLRNLLSDREKEVLLLIREGLASKEIADRIGISKHTIDRHRQNIIEKLQVSNTTQACFKAKDLGLIK